MKIFHAGGWMQMRATFVSVASDSGEWHGICPVARDLSQWALGASLQTAPERLGIGALAAAGAPVAQAPKPITKYLPESIA
jgi:hypothetical protein